MTELRSDGGMIVTVPESLTDKQAQAIQMVIHHGASTCKPEWAKSVFAREDKLNSSKRAIERAVAHLSGDHENKMVHDSLRSVLRKIEAA